MKVHFDCGQVHHGAAAFDLKLQGDSFVRSDAEHRPIRTQGVHGRILEGPVGACLKQIAISVFRCGKYLPVRKIKGTPAQRQLSISSLSATKVSTF